MIQLAPRASLVVVLLLASVGTASGACAWVTWGQARDGSFRPIGDGHLSLDDCRDRADFLTKRAKEKGDDTFVYSYLPDTVDPRVPKGGR